MFHKFWWVITKHKKKNALEMFILIRWIRGSAYGFLIEEDC